MILTQPRVSEVTRLHITPPPPPPLAGQWQANDCEKTNQMLLR